MTKTALTKITLTIVLIGSIWACQKDDASPKATNLDVSTLEDGYQVDRLKAKLGRVLFYDKSLSANNSISCGSCHKQELAFADDVALSPGFDNRVGNRNTPPIQNIQLNNQLLFWDGRETDLVEMSTKPIFNHIEMGIRSDEFLLNQIQSRDYYHTLFNEAFPGQAISTATVGRAIAAFIVNMRSETSRFDQSTLFTTGTAINFTPDELAGKDLFFGKYNCGSCHQLFNSIGYGDGIFIDDQTLTIAEFEQLDFRSFSLKNIGLDLNYTDEGLAEVTGNSEDAGKFKIPNLRNVELTGPYMHDGRFNTLEHVIEFYSKGINPHDNLDRTLTDFSTGHSERFNISEREQQQLIAFLKTLTDEQFVNDPKFSDPFQSN